MMLIENRETFLEKLFGAGSQRTIAFKHLDFEYLIIFIHINFFFKFIKFL